MATTLLLPFKWLQILRLQKAAVFSCLIAGFVIPAHWVVSAHEITAGVAPEATAVAAHPHVQGKMGHLPLLSPLIQDLGLILIAAAVMLLIFKWLRQPAILGYLVAGFVVSPYFLPTDPGHPLYKSYEWLYQYDLLVFLSQILSVRDTANIHMWAELGIIFVLFGLGLKFSFQKLLAIGREATVAGGFEVISTTIIGFFIGRMLGWEPIYSIFFGAMLAMSSTTVILKTFDNLKLQGKAYAPIVFGALVVEDLLAVLLLVLLSSIAISQTFVGGELAFAILELLFFLVLWLIAGIFLLPWFLKRCRKLLNDEILLLVSASLCFLMVMIACGTGFTSALGAFVMGSILAETAKGARIRYVIRPVKNLFAAVLFVYVGMMIDPAMLYKHAGAILLLAFLTVFIKFFAMGLGALIAGYNIRNAMCAGFSKAQIGEFAFIIAILGKQFEVIDQFLFSIIVAASAITMLMTPYLIFFSDVISQWLDRLIPEKFALVALRYEIAMDETVDRESIPLVFWRTHGLAIMLNVVFVVAIALGTHWLIPDVDSLSPIALLGFAVALLATLPCFWGIFHGRQPRQEQYDSETWSRLQQLRFGITVIRFLTGSILVVFFVSRFMDVQSAAGAVVSVSIVVFLFLFDHWIGGFYHRIEALFMSHLSDKERAAVEDRATHSHLMPWQAKLTEFTISEYSPLVMKTLQGSDLKQQFGVTVAVIKRAGKDIVAPRADEYLLPSDQLCLIGTYQQLLAAQAVIEFQPETEATEAEEHQFGMEPFRLRPEHLFVGKTIRECGTRELVNGLVVGVERDEQRHLNPDPNMVLQSGDMVWLVGEKQLLAKLMKSG